MKTKKILAGAMALTMLCTPAAVDFSAFDNVSMSASAIDVLNAATALTWTQYTSTYYNYRYAKLPYAELNSNRNTAFNYSINIDANQMFSMEYTGILNNECFLYDSKGKSIKSTKYEYNSSTKITKKRYYNLPKGTYYIRGTALAGSMNNNYSSVELYETTPEASGLSVKKLSGVKAGKTIYCSRYVNLTNNHIYSTDLKYKSSNPKVLTVDKYGNITTKKPGVAFVTVSVPVKSSISGMWAVAPASKTIKVLVAPKDINRAKGQIVKHRPNAVVKVTWTRDPNASGYIVYMSKRRNSKGQLVKPKRIVIKNNKVNYYKVRGLNRTSTYYFKIASYKKLSKKVTVYGNKLAYGFTYRVF